MFFYHCDALRSARANFSAWQARFKGGSRTCMPAQPRAHRLHKSESLRPTQLVSFSAPSPLPATGSGRLPSASDFGLSASLSGPHHRSVRNTFERLRAIALPSRTHRPSVLSAPQTHRPSIQLDVRSPERTGRPSQFLFVPSAPVAHRPSVPSASKRPTGR